MDEELKKRYPVLADLKRQRAYSLAKQQATMTRPDLPAESTEFYALVAAIYDNWINKGLFQE